MFRSLWELLWLMIGIYLLFMFIWILISIFSDIFRRPLSGIWKAAWIFVLISLPFLGALIYLIANGGDMQVRALNRVQEVEAAQADYIRSVSGSSTADELSKLASLRDSGVLNAEEFAAQKAKLLG